MQNENEKGLVTTGGNLPATAAEIKGQVQLIQQVMRDVMEEGVHYGLIPGCGDKPALFKPGAEKLCLTFRLAVAIDSQYVEHDRGHRTYTTIVKLLSPTGREVGEGIGVCSTMESKYRYRGQQVTFTDRAVPKDYWELRKTDSKKAQAMLGGPGFVAKKNENNMWMIAETTGERIEHPDPADYYNTCAKMSKKRAHVDASITTLAASDIFEQDLDEAETGDEVPTTGRKAADDGKPRPGKEAVAKTGPQDAASVERRNNLIADLSAKADEGMEALVATWAAMPEADRMLVGADFGRIKKLAEAADKKRG
jgi:hypothetical protein